jgi:hypothetical protein
MEENHESRWHTEEEVFLQKLQQQCEVLYKYNIKNHHYYENLSSRFNIPILIISAINSLTAVALNSFVRQEYVSVLNAVLSAGTGALGSIQLYLKITEKMTKATRSAMGFKRISLRISKELALAREVRTTEGPTFVTDCFTEYNQVLEAGNPVEKKMEEFLVIKPMEMGTDSSQSSLSVPAGFRSVAERLMSLARRSRGDVSPVEPMSP